MTTTLGLGMPIGDKQAAVQECVDGILKSRGIPQPIDRTKSLADYHYVKQNMPPFHLQVADCLRKRHYKYSYDATDAYMGQTVAQPLLQLYSTISLRTKASAPANLEMAVHLDAPTTAAQPVAPDVGNKKTKAKKAAPKKRVRKPAKKKTVKKIAKKRRAAKRGRR